jgi:protein tyrosine/serine phosphatase
MILKLISQFAIFFIFASSTFASDILGPNFHEVDPGRYYRSAQLNSKEFDYYIKKYKIRTIINLRGAEPQEAWYQDEISVSQKNLVFHFDIPMLAETLPHRENLIRLLDLFKTVPRPILVHCQGGADRSGEASAIYQMLHMGKTKEQALKMLTFKYHHLAFRKPAKRYFIKDLWQGEDWAYNHYDPCEGKFKYYDTNTAYCH